MIPWLIVIGVILIVIGICFLYFDEIFWNRRFVVKVIFKLLHYVTAMITGSETMWSCGVMSILFGSCIVVFSVLRILGVI